MINNGDIFNMSVPPRKHLHLELDLSAKVKHIKARKPEPTQKFLSSKYAIDTSTVSDILLGQYENNTDGKKMIMREHFMNSTN
jgi:hypothetical protein